MMWDAVVAAIKTTCEGDGTLVGLYGTAMRMSGTGDMTGRRLEWDLIGDAEDELWAPVTVQFDQYLDSMAGLVASERRLRDLFHRDLPAEIGGLLCWLQYVDGAGLGVPSRDQYYGRAVRFRITPLREQYAT